MHLMFGLATYAILLLFNRDIETEQNFRLPIVIPLMTDQLNVKSSKSMQTQ